MWIQKHYFLPIANIFTLVYVNNENPVFIPLNQSASVSVMILQSWHFIDMLFQFLLTLNTNKILTLPIAKRPLSKSRMTPRKMKDTPNATNPTPISASTGNDNFVTKYIHFCTQLNSYKAYTGKHEN